MTMTVISKMKTSLVLAKPIPNRQHSTFWTLPQTILQRKKMRKIVQEASIRMLSLHHKPLLKRECWLVNCNAVI